MDSAALARIEVTTIVQRVSKSTDSGIGPTFKNISSESCLNATSAVIVCLMPRVPLPTDFEAYLNATTNQGSSPITVSGNGTMSIQGPRGALATVYIGAIFDGYQWYKNFSSTLPSAQIKFYASPIINSSNGTTDFNPRRQTYIEILGNSMNLGTRLVDYTTFIGAAPCVGVDLTENVLSCQPPVDEPAISNSSTDVCAGMKLNSVMVHVVSMNPILYACIRYVSDPVSNVSTSGNVSTGLAVTVGVGVNPVNIGIAVGLSVGLGVLFVALIMVVIANLIHRKSFNLVANASNVYRRELRLADDKTSVTTISLDQLNNGGFRSDQHAHDYVQNQTDRPESIYDTVDEYSQPCENNPKITRNDT